MLTDTARANLQRMTEIPWEFWAAVIVIAIVGAVLAKASSAPYDPYADRSRLDVWDAPATCGHRHGPLVCGRARDHAPDFHADWTRDTERPVKWRDVRGVGEAS